MVRRLATPFEPPGLVAYGGLVHRPAEYAHGSEYQIVRDRVVRSPGGYGRRLPRAVAGRKTCPESGGGRSLAGHIR